MSSSSSCSVPARNATQNVDHISSSSFDFLTKINESEPTHGLLVPSKKRTNSNFAYTMILRGHTYHVCYRRQTPRGERVYWRCQLRGQCKARLITDLDGKIVQFTNPIHSHPSSAKLNTQQQSCIQALLTKVEENIDFLNNANNTLSLPSSLPPTSSPDNEYPTLNTGPINVFESPNTSVSSNGESTDHVKVSRKRHQNTSKSQNTAKSQQTGEIDIEEILRQIPQLQTLRFDSYYNEEDDEEVNNNEHSDDNQPIQMKKSTLTENDETVYEDTDSSSVASPIHLADSQRRYLLETLLQNSWTSNNNGRECIRKTFEFNDFNEAFGFMNRVAMKCEAIHRHPEWKNVYNKVHITLPINSSSLTIADLHLAQFMDEVLNH